MKLRTTLFVACLLLAACGQRGDLYLPEKSTAVVVPATGTAADEDEDAEDRPQQGTAGNAAGN